MKAAVLETFRRPLVIRDVPDPSPAPNGAVVRVAANGICRSDWHGWAGHWPTTFPLPHVLGHEMCGVVEEVGSDVIRHRPGDRVIVPFSGGDGTCAMCTAGLTNLCEDPVVPGFRSWGGFAEYVALDYVDVNLVPLPEAIGFVAGAGMGCRFMTAFHGLTDRAALRPGEWVAVFGCGGIGLSAIEIARALGARPIGIDIGDDKLTLAKELGAEVVVKTGSGVDAAEAVRDATGGGAHVSVDALGIAATCRPAIESLRKRGRHVQIGMANAEDDGVLPLPVDLIIGHEIVLAGSKGMPPADYPAMLDLVADGRLNPERLVSRTVPLEEAGDVLAAMDSFDTLGFTVIDRY